MNIMLVHIYRRRKGKRREEKKTAAAIVNEENGLRQQNKHEGKNEKMKENENTCKRTSMECGLEKLVVSWKNREITNFIYNLFC